MNEKLKEIAVKAQVEHCVSHVRLQEFAELIVKECISKVENEASTYAEPVWAFELINDIREHFGVTE